LNKATDFVPGYLSTSRPRGARVFEIIITARDVVGATAKVTQVFSDLSVNLIATQSRTESQSGDYVHIFFCDFEKAKASIKDVVAELKKMEFMKTVRYADVSNSIYEKFFFPIVSGDDRRVALLSVDALISVEKRMIGMLGTAGETLLIEEGKAFVKQTFDSMKDTSKELGVVWDTSNAADFFRVGGWGLFSYTPKAGGYVISVKSPISQGDGQLVQSRFMIGAAVAAVEHFASSELSISGTSYDPNTDTIVIYAKGIGRKSVRLKRAPHVT
jgi:ACT domain-containing protein